MAIKTIFVWFALLAVAFVRAAPLPETGSGSEDGGAESAMIAESMNGTQLNCSSPQANETELSRRVFSAIKGLQILTIYNNNLKNETLDLIDCPARVTELNSLTATPRTVRPRHLANWIAVFTTYARIAQEICDDRMLTVYNILDEIVGDYNAVLEPDYCNCENNINVENSCFAVPELYASIDEPCDPINYVIDRVITEAFYGTHHLFDWFMQNYQDPVFVSTEEWISTHDITSENTPDYDTLASSLGLQ